jgi:hypothetical protein
LTVSKVCWSICRDSRSIWIASPAWPSPGDRRLRVEALLAPGDLQLVQRGEVDGAELGDRLREPLDLGGQRRLVAEGPELVRKQGEVRVRLGELFRELLFRERGHLLLEPHVFDLRARRIELLLRREPHLVGRAQLGAEAFLAIARRGKRLFGGARAPNCR